MVRPDHFSFNSETAQSNAFQSNKLICENQNIRKLALEQFDQFVHLLKSHGINVMVFDSPKDQMAPDAVFPNNWISMHEDGKLIIYPMLTKNRRVERNPLVIDEISRYFNVSEIIDISASEEDGKILEGTGSLIFDHVNKVAYANESPRTDKHLFYDICEKLDYEGVYFKATDKQGVDIYHTNVMMTIGAGYAVICQEAIDKSDVSEVINKLEGSGLEVIEISYQQMSHFAGNMIQLQNNKGENFLVMSKSAYEILTEKQRNQLQKYNELLYSDISTIESIGGGSARCMIAGIHLLPKE